MDFTWTYFRSPLLKCLLSLRENPTLFFQEMLTLTYIQCPQCHHRFHRIRLRLTRPKFEWLLPFYAFKIRQINDIKVIVTKFYRSVCTVLNKNCILHVIDLHTWVFWQPYFSMKRAIRKSTGDETREHCERISFQPQACKFPARKNARDA